MIALGDICYLDMFRYIVRLRFLLGTKGVYQIFLRLNNNLPYFVGSVCGLTSEKDGADFALYTHTPQFTFVQDNEYGEDTHKVFPTTFK